MIKMHKINPVTALSAGGQSLGKRGRISSWLTRIVAIVALFMGAGSVSHAVETQYVTPNLLTVANGNFDNPDDAVSATSLPIGFTFRFGGVDYTQVQMSTNGILFFTGATAQFSNVNLSSFTGHNGVYALWDDLFLGNGSDEALSRSLYHTAGVAGSRVFIMQWTAYYGYADSFEVGTFNAVLYEGTNKIDIYYRNMLGVNPARAYGQSATIGLVADSYTTQYSINSPVAAEGKLLTYTPSAGGVAPYTLTEQLVTPATTAAIPTYFLSATDAPKVPTDLSAAPSTPVLTSATVSWSVGALGTDPEGFRLRYATNPQMTGVTEVTLPVSPQTHVLTGLTGGATYYYQVVSVAGTLSSISTISSFTQIANVPPVATGGSFTVVENVPYSGFLTATDSDNTPTTSGLIYSAEVQGAHGTAVITNSATGAFTYTSVLGYSGPDSFTFKAFDGTAYSNEATVSVTITSANTPPVLVLPASPVVAEATSAAGAVVTFSVSATDAQDGTAPAIATPASGSVFPLGDTTVNVSATDTASATTTGSFVVRVQDTTAPVITVPTNIVAEATSAAGAVVSFSVSATDAVSEVTPTAAPISGSVFPIGVTNVIVSATDAAGNPVSASFTVTVSDTTPPAVTAPANITVVAASAAGSVVTFSVSATDSVDGAVTAIAAPASGSLFPIGTTVVNVSATDAATNLGSASFTVTVQPSLVGVDDAVQAVAGVTLVYPLANDRSAFGNVLSIVSTSEPTVVIKGRALEIPAGFLGTFSYTITDGIEVGGANVVVSAGTPIASPTKWQGLLYSSTGEIAGRVTASKSTTKIVATIQFGAGSGAAIFPVAGVSGLAVPLGTVTASVNADKHLIFTLVNAGNTYTGDLRPGKNTSLARKHNIALASITPATIPGGGWARATTTGGARVGFAGKLPDGRFLFGNALVRDNGSFVLYRGIIGTNPRGVIGGEFIPADLAATDVTGELKWVLPPQARGPHAVGLSTTLTANGCVYNSAAPLPSGNAIMHLTGSGLAAPFDIAATLAFGAPTKNPAIPFWITYPVRGVFLASLKTPAAPLGARSSGIYLQKTNTAWGYVAGPIVGGRIEISLPSAF